MPSACRRRFGGQQFEQGAGLFHAAAMATAEQAGVDVDAVAAEYSAEQEAARAAAAEAAATEAANDRAATLKALVDEFDQRRVEQARALLELLPPEAPPAR